MAEFCIMPEVAINYTYKGFPMVCICKNERYNATCHRHEVFFGTYREKSIEDGLVVFIEPDYHISHYGVHNNDSLNRQLKKIAQQVAMTRYNWNKEDFIKRYGKNYLD